VEFRCETLTWGSQLRVLPRTTKPSFAIEPEGVRVVGRFLGVCPRIYEHNTRLDHVDLDLGNSLLSIIATRKTPGLLEELSIEAEFLSIIYPDLGGKLAERKGVGAHAGASAEQASRIACSLRNTLSHRPARAASGALSNRPFRPLQTAKFFLRPCGAARARGPPSSRVVVASVARYIARINET
jgi:hypothetical protein